MSPSIISAPTRFVRDRLFLTGAVTEVSDLTPRMRRVRIAGPRLLGLSWTPGQHVRLQVVDIATALRRLSPQDALRTYSIFDADPGTGTLDLVVFRHSGGDGPGAQWAATVTVGVEVAFMRPQGDFTVRPDAPYHLFAGEETASVTFAAMLRAMPADAVVHGAVEADSGADQLPLARPLTRVERHGAPTVLVDAVRALDLPDLPGVAYLGGEARTIQAVRAHLVSERGWNRRDVRTKPYWTPGRRGMD